MLYVLSLAAENSQSHYELTIPELAFTEWYRATHGTAPSDDRGQRARQLEEYVRAQQLTEKRIIAWRTQEDELRSHAADCPQRLGQECCCGAFEHNERIYAVAQEREANNA